MAFDSTVFLVFDAVVFSLHRSPARFVNVQNFLILVASYVFYAWWDWRFLGLIALSTLTNLPRVAFQTIGSTGDRQRPLENAVFTSKTRPQNERKGVLQAFV